MCRAGMVVCFSLACWAPRLPAQSAKVPSYAKDVRPFLVRYCVECHNARSLKAGLNLETYKALKEGSDNGMVMVPGKPDESLLVILTEGKKKPHMPPKKAARQPRPAEVAVLRAWVAGGAIDDSGAVKVVLPAIEPRSGAAAPVRALAYYPDGTAIIAGQGSKVAVIDSRTGKRDAKLAVALVDDITALAISDPFRVAVGFGKPGVSGTINSSLTRKSGWSLPIAHADIILDLAFSPDGTVLASCGYDMRVKLWDAPTGKLLHTLKDHSDSVYGVSFSRDSKLLATAAADRTVKVWDVASGRLLYTLSEATDWMYAVAWHPAAEQLAGGGVDRSIRIWRTGAEKGRIGKSVFAHEGAITRLIYSRDGKLLFSLGEDRLVKAWDAARMVERKVYDPQPALPLAMALRPDGKQLALGRFDGVVVLLDVDSGKIQHQVKLGPRDAEAPAKPVRRQGTGGATARQEPRPPAVRSPNPRPPSAVVARTIPEAGPRGQSIRLTLEGKHLDGIDSVATKQPGFKATIVKEGRSDTSLTAQIFFPGTTPAGVYPLTLHGPGGVATVNFIVDLFAARQEQEPNDSPRRGQRLTLPASIVGTLGKSGDVDYYVFDATQGQQLGVQVLAAAIGSKLEPFVQLTTLDGAVLAQSSAGLLGHTFKQAGSYALGIRDRQLRGGPDFGYRLHLGDIPIVTAIFPLGLQRGTEADLAIEGVNLRSIDRRRIKVPAEATPGGKLPVNLETPLGRPLGLSEVVVGEFAEVSSINATKDNPLAIPVPGTANGVLRHPGQVDLWTFTARKGQRLIVEVEARRLGSPLDSFIEIVDARNRPIPRATLRSLAKTFVTFRDHDSQTAGIRIDAWDELAVNDFILVGSELLKIKDLPPNPDADCSFFSDRGQRVGYFDTTPTHHSMGTPMYKVEVHPPGTRLPANGFPPVTLHYRNDDGGPGHGRDSRLTFDPPADGVYRVRIGDSRGQSGVDHAYRLTVRPPRPSFKVSFTPTSPKIFKGSAAPITVSAERIDGFDGAIDIALENLPPGISAPATSIPAGENSTVFALFAAAGAGKPPASAIKLVARARIDGRDVTRTLAGGPITLAEPGDIVTTTQQPEVLIKPGQQARLDVAIERRNNFKGRVPVEVRGLPHGVRVLDIGLNGILVTENETRRTIVIYAEPWVQPTEHPFVVLSRREGANTEHAARSVRLRIAGK